VTRRCVLVIPDAGPFNSLWVADALDLLLKLEMPIVVIDAVYDELTSDPENYRKDREVKAFIDAYPDVFIKESTLVGKLAAEARTTGTLVTGQGLGEAAIAQFFAVGIQKYAADDEPVVVLFEDSDIPRMRFFRRPDNMALLSTIGMVRGLAEEGVIPDAAAVIEAMTKPKDSTKKPRRFFDLPDGIDEPAAIGSRWRPET
jgi:hypothetical protein